MRPEKTPKQQQVLTAQTLKIHVGGDERTYRVTLAVKGGTAPAIEPRRESLGGHGRGKRVAMRVNGIRRRDGYRLAFARD
jgi:hypothetical protein